MIRNFHLTIFLLMAICNAPLNAQPITVQAIPLDSLTEFLQENLADDCIQILNASFTGSSLAIGSFTNPSNASFPLTHGIILSTGRVSNAVGPNSTSSMSVNNGQPGDSFLTTLIGHLTNDAAILEFDVVAQSGESISLDYIFGSEEYPEYVQSSVADIMGILISGQNLPYQNPYINWNIATVPGTNVAVSTNTITADVNSSFYIGNTQSSQEAIQFDGYTTVLTATTAIVPCKTYHFRISIADAYDGSFDSGLFLKAGSLSVGTVDTYKLYDLANLADTIMNGCSIPFMATKLDSMYLNDSIPVKPIFNAEAYYVDYDSNSDIFWIPGGTMSTNFILPTFPYVTSIDRLARFSQPTCKCVNRWDSVMVVHTSALPISASLLPPSALLCSSDTFDFELIIPFPYPDSLNFYWSNGSTSNSSLFVADQAMNILSVTIDDGCSQSISDETTILVFNQIEDLIPDSMLLVNDFALITAFHVYDATYFWSTGEHTRAIGVTEPGIYTLELSSSCGVLYDTIVVYQTIGIDSPNEEGAVFVYPNPADEMVYLSVNGNVNEEMLVSLYSMEGRLILQTTEMGNPIIELSIRDLPSGIYLLSIQQSKHNQTLKLIIE